MIVCTDFKEICFKKLSWLFLYFLPNFFIHLTCVAFQDATANDVPSETFEVQGYPTLYFRSASGKISQYDGNRTKEDIDFIEKNQDKLDKQEQVKDEL